MCLKPDTLPETNSKFAPENRPSQKERKLVFQPSIFRCELLVSGRLQFPFLEALWLKLPLDCVGNVSFPEKGVVPVLDSK